MHSCPTQARDAARVRCLSKLPPFPPVAWQLMRLVTVDEVIFRRVSDLIRSDAAFTAEVLRLANSPLMGCRQRIGSVLHALAVLGLDRLKALVMTVALRNFLSTTLQVPVLRRCWRHSVAAAFLAEQIGEACWLDPDQSYTGGLVHDLGRLAFMGAYPEEYARMLELADQGECDLVELERLEFEMDHCEAGRWLVGEWQFPAQYAEIVGDHHEPYQGGSFELADAARAACKLADMLGFQVAGPALLADLEEIRRELPASARDRLPAEEELLVTVAGKINALECSLMYS